MFADSVARGKPHPDGYSKKAERAGVQPERRVCLEGSENSVFFELDAGTKVIAVPDERFLLDDEVLALADAGSGSLTEFLRDLPHSL